MTPAQSAALAVAVDQLRESGVEPADVVRALYDADAAKVMLAGPVLLVGLRVAAWEYGRDMDIDQPGIFYFVDNALRAAGHGGIWAARGEDLDTLIEAANARPRVPLPVSPPETSTGVPVHRPEQPRGETL